MFRNLILLQHTHTHFGLRSGIRPVLLLVPLRRQCSRLHAGEYEQRDDVQAFAQEMQERYGFKKADVLAVLGTG
jgi:hypothetical protein